MKINIKVKFLIVLSILLTTAISLEFSAFKSQVFSNTVAECTEHSGFHYNACEPTLLEYGNKECWICCKCYKHFIEKPGEWPYNPDTDKPRLEKTSVAYLEPTLEEEDVENTFSNLESTVAIGSVPGGVDQLNYEHAKKYVEAYLKKVGVSESDLDNLTGIETYRGAENILKYKNSTSLGIGFNSNNTICRDGCTKEFDIEDDVVSGLTYHRINNPRGITGYNWLVHFYSNALNIQSNGTLQIFVRPENDCNLYSQVNEHGSDGIGATTFCAGGKWTAIVFNPKQVGFIKEFGTSYFGNGVRIQIRDSSFTGNLDFTSWYECNGKDLYNYHLISNENYHYGGIYNRGGVSVDMNTVLQSSNAWFKGLPKAENNTTSYRDEFVELYYSNPESSDKYYYDFKFDSPYWLGNNVYSSLYFSTGTVLKKTVQEMFVMVHSNTETDIHMSNMYDICKLDYEPKNVLSNTKIYKGWNLLFFQIPEGGLEIDYSGNTLFTIVPYIWKKDIELTITALFYKENTVYYGDGATDSTSGRNLLYTGDTGVFSLNYGYDDYPSDIDPLWEPSWKYSRLTYVDGKTDKTDTLAFLYGGLFMNDNHIMKIRVRCNKALTVRFYTNYPPLYSDDVILEVDTWTVLTIPLNIIVQSKANFLSEVYRYNTFWITSKDQLVDGCGVVFDVGPMTRH